MADTQRTVGVTLRTETEGETDAFKQAADQIGELEHAAEVVAPELAQAGAAVRDLGGEAKSAGDEAESLGKKVTETSNRFTRAADPTRVLKGDLRDLHEVAEVAGVSMEKLNKVLVSVALWQAASEVVEGLAKSLNNLDKALGGTGDAYDRFAGVVLVPKRSIEELVTALTDLDLYLDKHTGKLEEQKAAHESAREEYLKWVDAHVKVKGGAEGAAGAMDKVAEAAERAAEKARKAAEEVAEAWQKNLDQARDDAQRRTDEELEQLAAMREKQAQLLAEAAQRNADLLATAHEDVAKRLADAQAMIDAALGVTPDTSGLDTIKEKLDGVAASAERAATAIHAALEGGPLSAPEGGWQRIVNSGNTVAGQ